MTKMKLISPSQKRHSYLHPSDEKSTECLSVGSLH